jgi:hypothetical protein
MPTKKLTIKNSSPVAVEVTFNNRDKTAIEPGKTVTKQYEERERVLLRAAPSGKQAGLYKASEPAGQDMVADVSLSVAVIDETNAKLGFR